MAHAHSFRAQLAARNGHSFRREVRLRAARREDQDLKLFVLSFTAFFVCIYSFIF